MEVLEPKTKEEFEKYYDLRWRLLRKPWNQPRGSEKDELENQSIHIMVTDETSNIIGVGRGHFNSKDEAQIRYMAVEENQRGKGIGRAILEELENRLREKRIKYIVLNAREPTINFYKRYGYNIIEKAHILFDSISHFKMRKDLKY